MLVSQKSAKVEIKKYWADNRLFPSSPQPAALIRVRGKVSKFFVPVPVQGREELFTPSERTTLFETDERSFLDPEGFRSWRRRSGFLKGFEDWLLVSDSGQDWYRPETTVLSLLKENGSDLDLDRETYRWTRRVNALALFSIRKQLITLKSWAVFVQTWRLVLLVWPISNLLA